MDDDLFVVELKEEEGNEEEENVEERASGGGDTSLEDSVDMVLEKDHTNSGTSFASPDVRIIIAPSDKTGKTVEFENTSKSENRESYLLQFFQFGLLSFIFKITNFNIKVNNTVKKYTGYVAVTSVHTLQTFCCSLIEKEKNDCELDFGSKHFLDIIRKTAFLDVVENKNGSQILPQPTPNTGSSINVSALSCLLKVLVAFILAKLRQNYNRLGVIPVYLTNLRPVMVGISSAEMHKPIMDISDIWSFLHWPDSTAATAKDLYNKGFHCLDSTVNCIQCLSCGNIVESLNQLAVCCTPRRILRFEGPISVAEMKCYMQSMISFFEHSTLPHLRPVGDNFLTSSMSSDVERFLESGLYPTDGAGVFSCFECKVTLGNWQESHDAVLRHAAVSLHCPHILKRCGPAFIYYLRESLLQAGMILTGYIGQHYIRHPEFRLRSVREQTRTRTSLNVERKWSNAGFFFKDGFCHCFCCGITMADIRESDDPWSVHFSYGPNCPFLLESRPEYFAMRAGCLQPTEEQRALVRQFAVATGQDNEATNGVIRLRVDGILDGNDSSSFSAVENVQLFEADPPQVQAPADEGDEEIERIQEENKDLQRQLLCGICEENERTIAFLPCSHVFCCAECAPAYMKCPSCQTQISGVVNIYLS